MDVIQQGLTLLQCLVLVLDPPGHLVEAATSLGIMILTGAGVLMVGEGLLGAIHTGHSLQSEAVLGRPSGGRRTVCAQPGGLLVTREAEPEPGIVAGLEAILFVRAVRVALTARLVHVLALCRGRGRTLHTPGAPVVAAAAAPGAAVAVGPTAGLGRAVAETISGTAGRDLQVLSPGP